MISSNCTFKLLDKVHIGCSIRMTSDKSTTPFNNIPLTNAKIEKYDKMGFYLSHKDLPKNIWVDFDQLPLTNLTIKNGIIQDEITFVENILNHKMEFIKTDTLDYIELVHIKKNEKVEQFSSITSIKPGEIVKSALCNGGEDMIFLGNFYTKQIESKRHYNNSYSRSYTYKYYLSKNSPQRALFLIVSNELSQKEKVLIAKQFDYYDYSDYDHATNSNNYCIKLEKEKLLASSNIDRFKLIDFSITSKQIKNVVKLNKIDNRFTNIENNGQLIINEANTYYHYMDHYRKEHLAKHEEKMTILKHELPLDFDTTTYTLVNSKLSDINYVSSRKENLDKNAIEFINNNYTIELEKQIYQ